MAPGSSSATAPPAIGGNKCPVHRHTRALQMAHTNRSCWCARPAGNRNAGRSDRAVGQTAEKMSERSAAGSTMVVVVVGAASAQQHTLLQATRSTTNSKSSSSSSHHCSAAMCWSARAIRRLLGRPHTAASHDAAVVEMCGALQHLHLHLQQGVALHRICVVFRGAGVAAVAGGGGGRGL